MSDQEKLDFDDDENFGKIIPGEGIDISQARINSHHEILVDLKQDGANYIGLVTLATGQKGKIIASNKSITQMYQGRGYYIPVNKDIDSDEFANMKIFSNIAGILDVKFVKDGYAYVIPIQHSITLNHNQRLCWVW